MRLIDADELNEIMYQQAFEKDSDMQKWDSGCWIRYKLFENCLQRTQTQSVWISCFERKPEIPGFYLVSIQLKTGNKQVAIGMYSPLLNTWSGNGNFDNVTAWMPLPEPYKGELK